MSVVVEADRERAFEYVADGRAGLLARPKGTTFSQEPPGIVRAGTTFTYTGPDGSRWSNHIEELDRPARLVTLAGPEGQRPMRAVTSFEDVQGGTLIRTASELGLYGPWWARPLMPLLLLLAAPKLWWRLRKLKAELRREVMSDARSARERLIWALRWIAADPELALRAMDGAFMNAPARDNSGYVPDELALTLEDALRVARSMEILTPELEEAVGEMDRVFDSISGAENAEHWTPEAVRTSRVWAEQRDRARKALALMGEPRADHDLPGHV
jgi:hypothetical protein